MDKLKVGWGLRARKYEEKIRDMDDRRWIKICWTEKHKNGWKDIWKRKGKILQ